MSLGDIASQAGIKEWKAAYEDLDGIGQVSLRDHSGFVGNLVLLCAYVIPCVFVPWLFREKASRTLREDYSMSYS